MGKRFAKLCKSASFDKIKAAYEKCTYKKEAIQNNNYLALSYACKRGNLEIFMYVYNLGYPEDMTNCSLNIIDSNNIEFIKNTLFSFKVKNCHMLQATRNYNNDTINIINLLHPYCTFDIEYMLCTQLQVVTFRLCDLYINDIHAIFHPCHYLDAARMYVINKLSHKQKLLCKNYKSFNRIVSMLDYDDFKDNIQYCNPSILIKHVYNDDKLFLIIDKVDKISDRDAIYNFINSPNFYLICDKIDTSLNLTYFCISFIDQMKYNYSNLDNLRLLYKTMCHNTQFTDKLFSLVCESKLQDKFHYITHDDDII
jgi:hypothetical protein